MTMEEYTGKDTQLKKKENSKVILQYSWDGLYSKVIVQYTCDDLYSK